jgi:two-component sensor histidine kinase
VPRLLVEVAVGVTIALALVSARMSLQPIVGDRAPFTVVTLGMVIACVIAGWRSGLVAVAVGQSFTWYAVIEPRWSFALPDSQRAAAVALSTFAQFLILIVVALYQKEVAQGLRERERRAELLQHALGEIDHRTRNNYQAVLAVIRLQAQRATEPKVQAALQQVANRIEAIAGASQRLALRSGELDTVRLDEHLCELCEQIERGLSRQEIEVQCDIPEVPAEASRAMSISLIVNELVTNALKHAFVEGANGRVKVFGKMNATGLELTVEDNGSGIKNGHLRKRTGLGTKLVEDFVRQLGAVHETMSSDRGTVHRLVIPEL